jgi:hypothetical protein
LSETVTTADRPVSILVGVSSLVTTRGLISAVGVRSGMDAGVTVGVFLSRTGVAVATAGLAVAVTVSGMGVAEPGVGGVGVPGGGVEVRVGNMMIGRVGVAVGV